MRPRPRTGQIASAVFLNFLNRLPGCEMEGIVKKSLIYVIFMTSSMHAAIFLVRDYSENPHSVMSEIQIRNQLY